MYGPYVACLLHSPCRKKQKKATECMRQLYLIPRTINSHTRIASSDSSSSSSSSSEDEDSSSECSSEDEDTSPGKLPSLPNGWPRSHPCPSIQSAAKEAPQEAHQGRYFAC